MTDVPHPPATGHGARDSDDSEGARAEDAGFTSARGSRASAELYRLLVETLRDYAILALDTSGHILSWNEGAQRMTGYRLEDVVGKHFSILYARDDVAEGAPSLALTVAKREGRFEADEWRIRKDGSRFCANVVIAALRDKSGELAGFAEITRDVTARRGAEEVLRSSEERFRLLVHSVKDYAIFMLDPDGRVASWNEGAQRIKGYTADDIIGRHFSTFYPHEDNAAGIPPWELEVATAEGRFEGEGWRLRKDGSRFWANVVITAVRDSAGRLIGFAKVTRDLTERRAAEQRALEDTRRLADVEAADRAKGQFLAAMSHELRTPLNAIGGYAQLLLMEVRGPLSAEQRADLERIQQSQEHLLGIINDVLNFSRVEGGRVNYDIEPVQLVAVLDSVTRMLEPQARQKGLSFERVDCDPNAFARSDRAKTEQIVVNLLSNAVKFTPSGGRVTLGCSIHGDRVRVTVTDTGPGVPQDKRAEIFEPFVQLGRTLSTSHEGVGLGLAISRDLARAMDGDLTLAETPGDGATFTLDLPAAT